MNSSQEGTRMNLWMFYILFFILVTSALWTNILTWYIMSVSLTLYEGSYINTGLLAEDRENYKVKSNNIFLQRNPPTLSFGLWNSVYGSERQEKCLEL